MSDIVINIPEECLDEYSQISNSLRDYPNYVKVAQALGNYYSQEIVAGMIGCIIPESGCVHTILNKAEFRGKGVSGTDGWNCGEGLIQWTYWKYKLPLIKEYNADSRSVQKLPTDWETYKVGTPIENGKNLYSPEDGRHIAGLGFDDQILFFTLYYKNVVRKLKGETDLGVIVAKIYQQKAGSGMYQEISDPFMRAYTTGRKYSKRDDGTYGMNHFLLSVKMAQDYLNVPVEAVDKTEPVSDYVYDNTGDNTVVNNNDSSNTNTSGEIHIQMEMEDGSMKEVTFQAGHLALKFTSYKDGDVVKSNGDIVRNGTVIKKKSGERLGSNLNQK